MLTKSVQTAVFATLLVVAVSGTSNAQVPAGAQNPASTPGTAAPPPGTIYTTVCGENLGEPAATPPAGLTFLWQLELCFDKQGGSSTVEGETYMYYIKLRGSQPSQGIWIPYDDKAEQQALTDFKTMMRSTSYLEDT